MPSFTVHLNVAEKDGIDRSTMKEYNEMIDVFHNKSLKIPPREAEYYEVELLDVLIRVVKDFPKKDKPCKGLKAICHHYTLDFLQKKGYEFFIEVAKKRGLIGVYNSLFNNNSDTINIRRIAKNRSRDMGQLSSREKYLVKSFAADMLEDAKDIIEEWHAIHRAESLDEVKKNIWSFENLLKGLKRHK